MGDNVTELTDTLGKLNARIDAAIGVMQESKATDTARWTSADAERQAAALELGDVKGKIERAERETATDTALAEWQALKASTHMPSKAGLVGPGRAPVTGYQAGDFLSAVMGSHSNDPETYGASKAALARLGSSYMEVPGDSKATLGLTAATGGFIVPNNFVADLVKPNVQDNLIRSLVTVIHGITGNGVDQPYRSAAVTRATVIAPGSLKENLNLTYTSYTATLYTIARIYDLSTRFVRTSAGAAEADVIQELTRAISLGEQYYVYSGAGTTEPEGILTALAAAAPTFDATFTGATTLVGSVMAGLATASGLLAARNQTATAAVMNGADYWQMFRQGADAAGFYAGGALTMDPTNQVRVLGIPVYADNSIASDTLLVGNFKAAKLFVGQDFRIDTNDQAGTRWDYNLIGFRGEEDIAFDARAAVASGAFERITNLVP